VILVGFLYAPRMLTYLVPIWEMMPELWISWLGL